MSERIHPVLMLVACAAFLPLGGCYLTHTTVPVWGSVVGTSAGYAANKIPAGPRVTFVNETPMTISVRYWSGRRDTTAPSGVADMRTGDDMAFRSLPGDFFISQVGRPWWPTSMTDAVVRAQIDVEAPDGTRRGPIWIELEQPQPFRFAARGDSPDTIEFHRFGGGTIAPVPRGDWIDGHNGPFPVDNDLAVH